ncbi:MAG: hypothetical protein IKF07_08385 [Eubacterium sp.]|nr:hypothetical protein [Eubacterium sp.]
MAGKERDYMFDTFRGLLMLSIPISHFTKMTGNLYSSLYLGGGFPKETLFGFMYITINVFVMQAFMFLSGYFSKKPERARETAFSTFMWPYLVFTFIYFLIRFAFFGSSHLTFLSPPFALWFLFSLFFYRYFLVDMVKFKWLLPVAIVLGLLAGQVEEWSDFLALGRTMSYFASFLIGYYCSPARLRWCQKLREHKVMLVMLGVFLVAFSIMLCFIGPNVGWYLLRESYHSFKITWWQDIVMRAVILVISCLWIIFCVNVIPSKKGFLAYVGANTMPVYMFHLTLRYVIQFYGSYIAFIGCLIVAWLGIISLIYKKGSISKAVYVFLELASIAGFIALFASGVLQPLYGGCPENIYLAYLICYGGAIICGVSFVTPFWVNLYDFLINGTNKLPQITKWLKGPDCGEEQ